jgi:hypothetical protein
MLGQSDLRQRAGETEPVQKPKAEGDQPWHARRQAWPSAPCVQNLDRNKHNAERDGCIERRTRHVSFGPSRAPNAPASIEYEVCVCVSPKYGRVGKLRLA